MRLSGMRARTSFLNSGCSETRPDDSVFTKRVIVVTVMPCGVSSMACCFTSITRPPLVAAYAEQPLPRIVSCERTERRWIRRPPRPAAICTLAAACARKIAGFEIGLVDAVEGRFGDFGQRPLDLHADAIGLDRAHRRCRNAQRPDRSRREWSTRRSHRGATALVLRHSEAMGIERIGLGHVVLLITTCAPCMARPKAMASPRPPYPPGMKATSPARSSMRRPGIGRHRARRDRGFVFAGHDQSNCRPPLRLRISPAMKTTRARKKRTQ